MELVNILIPLHMFGRKTFFKTSEDCNHKLFNYEVSIYSHNKYLYLDFRDVPFEAAQNLIDKVRTAISWASLRLNFSMRAAEGELRVEDATFKIDNSVIFDGQFITAYPSHLQASPMRAIFSIQTREPDDLFFKSLNEASILSMLIGSGANNNLRLACDLFSSIDFEATLTAQLLLLTSILEVLANPTPRPNPCLKIIEDAMERMKSEAETTIDAELRETLNDMHKAANHWAPGNKHA